MLNEIMPTGSAVACRDTVGGWVGGGVSPAVADVDVSKGMGVELAIDGGRVALGGAVLLGDSVSLGVRVTIVMADDDGGTAMVANAVAVISAAVGGLGVTPATTQPAHSRAANKARHPPLGRNMPAL